MFQEAARIEIAQRLKEKGFMPDTLRPVVVDVILDVLCDDRTGDVLTVPSPLCGLCGGRMSKNPHLDAGKPGHILDAGLEWECIPCLARTRHRWADRALRAEGDIAADQP